MTKFKTGDLVRVVKEITVSKHNNPYAPQLNIGDVVTVAAEHGSVEIIRQDNGRVYKGGGWIADRFELIARAGKPVIFQPGDVIELISNPVKDYREIGQRFTVDAKPFAPSGSVRHNCAGGVTWAPVQYFKLVHRPVEGEKLDRPVEGEKLDRPISVDEIKPGDLVTVRAQVKGYPLIGGGVSVDRRVFYEDEIIGHKPAPEKPLAVGDRVRSYRAGLQEGTLIGVHRDKAWVEVNPDRTYTAFLSNLERVR